MFHLRAILNTCSQCSWHDSLISFIHFLRTTLIFCHIRPNAYIILFRIQSLFVFWDKKNYNCLWFQTIMLVLWDLNRGYAAHDKQLWVWQKRRGGDEEKRWWGKTVYFSGDSFLRYFACRRFIFCGALVPTPKFCYYSFLKYIYHKL